MKLMQWLRRSPAPAALLELRPSTSLAAPADSRALEQSRLDAEILERWRRGVDERIARAIRVKRYVYAGVWHG